MPSDFPPRDGPPPVPQSATPTRPLSKTPQGMPTARDLNRGTPVPINLERFVQRLLAASQPLGSPERFVRDLLVEGLKAKIPQLTATRTGALVGSNLLKILSQDPEDE